MFPCGFARQSRWPPGAGRLPPQAGYRARLQPPALAPADPAPALVGGDLGAVLEVQLLQNAVDVVLDGARRNEEALRYLLVAGPLAGQLQHLDFARREIGAGLAYLSVAVRLANEGVQNALRHRRGDNGFSPQRALQHLEQFVGLHVLQQVAVGAAADRLEQVLLVLGHREHDDLGVRQLRLYEARGLDAVAAGHPDVHENDVWLQPAGLLHALPAVACLFDDGALPPEGDELGQRAPQESVVVDQEESLGAHGTLTPSTGMATSTRVPAPSRLSMTRLPPTLSARSLMVCRPNRPLWATLGGSNPGPLSRTTTRTSRSLASISSHTSAPGACLLTLARASWTMRTSCTSPSGDRIAAEPRWPSK